MRLPENGLQRLKIRKIFLNFKSVCKTVSDGFVYFGELKPNNKDIKGWYGKDNIRINLESIRHIIFQSPQQPYSFSPLSSVPFKISFLRNSTGEVL